MMALLNTPLNEPEAYWSTARSLADAFRELRFRDAQLKRDFFHYIVSLDVAGVDLEEKTFEEPEARERNHGVVVKMRQMVFEAYLRRRHELELARARKVGDGRRGAEMLQCKGDL